MLFPTVDFAVFFAVVLAAYWATRRWALGWRLLLVAASYFFYAYWDPALCLLLGGSTVANWALGKATHRTLIIGHRSGRTRLLISLTVATNLAVLGWFKYYGFFATEARAGLSGAGIDLPLPLIQVALPVGISFFTFQGMSYVIDIARGTIDRPLGLLDFTLFQSFFPQLVAGPIVRASEIGPQLARPLSAKEIDVHGALLLILAGLFKKVVISSFLATAIVDPVFAMPGDHSRAEILLATYAYAVQIFADFSGYTDIAIGCALLLGFRFPQNFDAPYRALSIQDFWRRWHMTLSRWLRDYLYIGLGGNRGRGMFTARNLLLTMVLGGLWHGAAWTFVAWGTIHGVALVAERFIPILRPSARTGFSSGNVLRWLATFHLVAFAWVFFRAESIDGASAMFRGMWQSGPDHSLVTPLVVTVVALAIASQFISTATVTRARNAFGRLSLAPQVACLAVGLVLVDAFGPTGIAPFIYFQF